jgi:hypothetical protein
MEESFVLNARRARGGRPASHTTCKQKAVLSATKLAWGVCGLLTPASCCAPAAARAALRITAVRAVKSAQRTQLVVRLARPAHSSAAAVAQEQEVCVVMNVPRGPLVKVRIVAQSRVGSSACIPRTDLQRVKLVCPFLLLQVLLLHRARHADPTRSLLQGRQAATSACAR